MFRETLHPPSTALHTNKRTRAGTPGTPGAPGAPPTFHRQDYSALLTLILTFQSNEAAKITQKNDSSETLIIFCQQ